jgi:hypothetical protein
MAAGPPAPPLAGAERIQGTGGGEPLQEQHEERAALLHQAAAPLPEGLPCTC